MRQRWKSVFQIGLLVMAGSLFIVGCEQKPSDAATKANEERWQNFQETNQKDVSTAMSAYEKRQQQLAEKKKAEANKTAATASPAPTETAPKK